MKILRNKAYRELIAEKELTELSLKSLKSKYEFISDENKKLHLKNDLLHIEIKSLREKAEKYDIYLQKSKARKAKARAKEKGLQKKEVIAPVIASEPVYQGTPMSEVEKFARENLGRKVILTDKSKRGGSTCFISGYSKSGTHVLVGFETIGGWSISGIDTDIVKLNNHKSYWFAEIDEIVFN